MSAAPGESKLARFSEHRQAGVLDGKLVINEFGVTVHIQSFITPPAEQQQRAFKEEDPIVVSVNDRVVSYVVAGVLCFTSAVPPQPGEFTEP